MLWNDASTFMETCKMQQNPSKILGRMENQFQSTSAKSFSSILEIPASSYQYSAIGLKGHLEGGNCSSARENKLKYQGISALQHSCIKRS